MVIVTGAVVLFAGVLASIAVTLTDVVPAVVGVPLMLQSFARVKPAGMVLPPARAQVYGAVPPLTPMDPAYAKPTVPAGGELSVRVAAAAGFTVMVIGAGAV